MIEKKLEEIYNYGRDNQIPITQDKGLVYLGEQVQSLKPKRILEIGTAIGFSALYMHKLSGAEVVSIERDQERFSLAQKNLGEYPQIKLINADALEIDNDPLGKFDLIYFDAAKAQNKKFLEKFKTNLKPGGVILIDNLDFHGLRREDPSKLSRNMRQMMRKLNDFITYCKQEPMYNFELIEVGDSMGRITINDR